MIPSWWRTLLAISKSEFVVPYMELDQLNKVGYHIGREVVPPDNGVGGCWVWGEEGSARLHLTFLRHIGVAQE